MALGRVPASLAGALSWFPGHMAKAQASIAGRLPSCDLVLEVRDARLPVSSASSAADSLRDSRKRWVVLNKADLCGRRMLERHLDRLAYDGIHALAVTSKSPSSMIKVRLIVPNENVVADWCLGRYTSFCARNQGSTLF